MKECRTCGLSQPQSAFQVVKRKRYLGDGRSRTWLEIRSQCKPCTNAIAYKRKKLAKLEEPEAEIELPMLAPTTKLELYLLANAACRGDKRYTLSFHGGMKPALRQELTAKCEACPVFAECRAEGDRIEMFNTYGDNTAFFSGFRAGESPFDRSNRRKAVRVSNAT